MTSPKRLIVKTANHDISDSDNGSDTDEYEMDFTPPSPSSNGEPSSNSVRNINDNVNKKRPANFEDNHYGKKLISSKGLNSNGHTMHAKVEMDFCFYLTKVSGLTDSSANYLSMDISDILSNPLGGDLLSSVQFNFMIDAEWLIQKYPTKSRDKPLLLINGDQGIARHNLLEAVMKYPNVEHATAKLHVSGYGVHHSKMMILLFQQGLQIAITTANLVPGDWHQKTQGIWISPLLNKLSSDKNGESETMFKKDLIAYLNSYRLPKLKSWINTVNEYDFSPINVFLIGTVPGRFTNPNQMKQFGHLKLRDVLLEHFKKTIVEDVQSDNLLGQFSSIGSMGKLKDSSWLNSEWRQSLSSTAVTNNGNDTDQQRHLLMPENILRLHLIFPTVDNVRNSLEGYAAGGSIPYSSKVAKNQMWLHRYFHQWKAHLRKRNLAAPHIKSYGRFSHDWSKCYWFLLSSANLSKSAWGYYEKNGSQFMMRSYELGVLFLPQYLGYKENYFSVPLSESNQQSNLDKLGDNSFPFPYDLPPTPYSKSDIPWMWDVEYSDYPDSHGNVWQPHMG